MMMVFFLSYGLLLAAAGAQCPYMDQQRRGLSEKILTPTLPSMLEQKNAQHLAYLEATKKTDWDVVRSDIREFLRTSQDSWPADYGDYGPLFIRLAWHNTGSYRTSDGRGGADGARQRFDPERSWDDNTNLDKARALLFTVKEKHPEVSWGDLIVLTGTEAIRSAGGPVLGFCSGRIDDEDGSDSVLLGPTLEQENYAPCPLNGACEDPLGSTTVGLIYLNPQGPLGVPDSYGSAADVRDSFGRMSMNDTETVALIGGGHTFGKAHGACPRGPGDPPSVNPSKSWPGNCGTGQKMDTYTSGIEGSWTTNPTVWDNEYFNLLLSYDWVSRQGPGGAWQWQVNPISSSENPTAPAADGQSQKPTMMMTSDMSLTTDSKYRVIVETFAAEQSDFEEAFSAAWYKLMTRDMGPITRCGTSSSDLGLPAPQDFQHYLEPVTEVSYDLTKVQTALYSHFEHSKQYLGQALNLAYACASTFRYTDYLGGCNGARHRFEPAYSWKAHGYGKLIDDGILALTPVKEQFQDAISWADLIVLAGNVALETAAPAYPAFPSLSFCPGRSDDTKGDALEYLEPPVVGDIHESPDALKEYIQRTGISYRDYVALLGARRALSAEAIPPFYGNFTSQPLILDNTYFKDLLHKTYVEFILTNETTQYKALEDDIYANQIDVNVKFDAELQAIAQEYAMDNERFLNDLASAWSKLMNADRFDKPECLPVGGSNNNNDPSSLQEEEELLQEEPPLREAQQQQQKPKLSPEDFAAGVAAFRRRSW